MEGKAYNECGQWIGPRAWYLHVTDPLANRYCITVRDGQVTAVCKE